MATLVQPPNPPTADVPTLNTDPTLPITMPQNSIPHPASRLPPATPSISFHPAMTVSENHVIRGLRDEIRDRVREAAEAEGRVYAIM